MKGVVFTEFIEMVEERFSADIADQIIDEADLPSGGAYTSVGTYSHEEMLSLVDRLAAATDTPVPDLMRTFGEYLFGRFAGLVPHFFEGVDSAFGFLQLIDGYIHVEVRKLYPDADLPKFEYQSPNPGCLHMIYRSSRPFADLAEGLINGCIAHFEEAVEVAKEDISDSDGLAVRFILTQKEGPS